MIFQHTAPWVLDRSPHTGEPKTQTRRPAKHGDRFVMVGDLLGAERHDRLLYLTDETYSIQPGRGKRALGRFRLRGIRYVVRADFISEADARAEGFESPDAFRQIWVQLYGLTALEQPCYALTIDLVK